VAFLGRGKEARKYTHAQGKEEGTGSDTYRERKAEGLGRQISVDTGRKDLPPKPTPERVV
jgi:hypothetical protein